MCLLGRQLVDALEWCLDLGVTTVSVYAFSVDNFRRPPAEVATLMELARVKLREIITARPRPVVSASRTACRPHPGCGWPKLLDARGGPTLPLVSARGCIAKPGA